MKTIAIAGTFDTKGKEYLYVKGLVEELGLHALTIHTGVFEPEFTPDVSNAEVAAAAGYDIRAIVERKDRAMATEALSKGMETLVLQLYGEGRFDGILSFGGSGGTSMVTPAMRALPIGVPKLMVSTMASGNVEQYVGTSDIVMMPSIVDVAVHCRCGRAEFHLKGDFQKCGPCRLRNGEAERGAEAGDGGSQASGCCDHVRCYDAVCWICNGVSGDAWV